MLDMQNNKRQGSSGGLSSRPSQISLIRRDEGIIRRELNHSSSPPSNLSGMSADAAERRSSAANNPKPTPSLRGMSADAAERRSDGTRTQGTQSSNLRGMSADATERWSNAANNPKPTSNLRGMSADATERWSNAANNPKPTSNLRGMSADAAERWSLDSTPKPQLAITSRGEQNNGVVTGIAVGTFVASRASRILLPVPTEASRAAKPLVLSATLQDGSNSIREIPLRRVRFSQGDVSSDLTHRTPQWDDQGRVSYLPKKKEIPIPLSQVVEGMRKHGWDYTTQPPDVVRFEGRKLSIGGRKIPIGRSQYVTLDHRRLVAAREAGIRNIPARIHSENDLIRHNMPSEPGRAGTAEAERFKLIKVKNIEGKRTEVRYIDPKTRITHGTNSKPSNWGEAVRHRGASQRVRGHENFPLEGTKRLPEMIPRKPGVANTTLSAARAVGESRVASVALRGVSRVAAPIGVAIDAWRLGSAYEKDGFGQEFRETAGSVAGGWGGAAAGAAIGSFAGPPGMIVGGIIGGFAGSEFGDDIEQGAEKAGEAIAGGAKKAWNEVFG